LASGRLILDAVDYAANIIALSTGDNSIRCASSDGSVWPAVSGKTVAVAQLAMGENWRAAEFSPLGARLMVRDACRLS
jgi:hypothetical protein